MTATISNAPTTAAAYTVTLDDDAAVAPLIASATGVPSRAFLTWDALQAAMADRTFGTPLAVFVDIHLDLDVSGLDIIPALRSHWPHTPILVITSATDDEAVGLALAAGAHDFVRKPFKRVELQARFNARAKEAHLASQSELLQLGPLMLNRRQRTLERGSIVRHLSPSQAHLLVLLAAVPPGSVLTRDEVKQQVWGKIHVSDNALDRKLSELRTVLKDFGPHVQIKAVYGVGVRLDVIPLALLASA